MPSREQAEFRDENDRSPGARKTKIPEYVVVDTRDGYTLWRDTSAEFFTAETAQAFIKQRNTADNPGQWVTRQLVEPAAATSSFHVEDNVTGARASRDFTSLDNANVICGVLNTPAAGGRYGVYFADGTRVPWDYRQPAR